MQKPSNLPDAAVIIIISGEAGQEQVLLTERAQGLREHAGEVALPGGKRDHQDKHLFATALRECHEEVGIAPSLLAREAELSPHYTRRGAEVAPFVVRVAERPELTLNSGEIASAFWAPLSLFINDERSHTHIFRMAKQEYWAPVYRYEQYEIWGFTSRVLVSLVNTCFEARLGREHVTAPEVLYV